MHEPAASKELDEHLDILGQQPSLSKLYTQICFCFALADASSHSAIINTLRSGLERLSTSFPWLAGRVVSEGADEGGRGTLKIKSSDTTPRLAVRDVRDDLSLPTMDALRRNSFPFSMLDEADIAPCKTLPTRSDKSASGPSPVFLLQANFITDGLLLTFVGQHNVMDMTGQGEIIYLFSKACRNEPFTSAELSSGNLSRRDLIPLLDDSYEPGSELAHQIAKPRPSHSTSNTTTTGSPAPAPPPRPHCIWAYFAFPATSLTALKSLATTTLPHPSTYISTDDALTAFIWQSVSRSRLLRLNPTTPSTLARAVDVRRYLAIPATYPGVIQNMTYHTSPLHQLSQAPLGVIASQLRSAVDPQTSKLANNTRALATVLDRAQDKSTVSVVATIDPSAGLMLSSWTKLDSYALDFALGLGLPEAVRRPRFTAVEGLVYLMPRARDGGVAVAVCARDEDLEALKADEVFGGFGRFVG